MNGLQTIEWRDVDYEVPPPGETVLVYGGLAFISADGVWHTEMERPCRPIMWRVTHWAALPYPPQSLIDQTETQRKVTELKTSIALPHNGFVSPAEASMNLCDKCLADGTREPSIGLARFPNDASCYLCAQCAEDIVRPL